MKGLEREQSGQLPPHPGSVLNSPLYTKPLVRWAGTEMAQAHSFLLQLVPAGSPPALRVSR